MSSNQFTSAGRFRSSACETRSQYSPGAALAFDSTNGLSDSVLLGESVAIRRLRSQIQRIAPHFRTALIRGEAGSGKQLVARAIHALSPGADGPFIVTTASVLAGSFAAGEASRIGGSQTAESLVESAQGGTLYIAGVGELSFAMQAALFHFIRACEERRAATPPAGRTSFDGPDRRRSGTGIAATRLRATRMLAASDRDLKSLAGIGQFRQDLYACLSAVEIFVPPLRQRMEDIPMLAEWLLRRLAEETGRSPKLLAEATMSQLQERLWPNNLGELEYVLAHAAALAEGCLIEPRHLLALVGPVLADPSATPMVKSERLHDVIERHVLDVLTRCSGNKLRAAELLGISRSTLYRMLDARPESTGGRIE